MIIFKDILKKLSAAGWSTYRLQKEKQMRYLGDNWRVNADEALLSAIRSRLGNENVQTVTKPLK